MFLIHQSPTVNWEYLPVNSADIALGEMLTTGEIGLLSTASGTTKPQYISMCELHVEESAGVVIPVIRVTEDIIFETTASVSMSGVKVGNKVCLSSDGKEVNASTTDGVAEIVWMEDTAAGSKVRVRFS